MSERLKAMRRIHKVQSQVKRLAEVRLADAERRKQALATEIEDLSKLLDGPIPVGDLAQLASRQRQRLAVREQAAEVERNKHAKAAAEAQSRLNTMERRVGDLRLEDRRAQEKKDLERLLDVFLAKPATEHNG